MEVPKILMRKKSNEDEQTLAELSSAHRRSPQCQLVQTSYLNLISNRTGTIYRPIHLSAQNVFFGVLSKQCPLSNLLNYFIVIGKLFLWDCRSSQTLLKIQGLQSKLKIKYETEKNINKKNFFEKKWVLTPI